ncbi:MAG: hypothetical protein DYG98_13115 [Haliscomenobacteraceae bacterium CHB4]|nr:hypothetical protein [Haliscomenobacteraceae bacterium CHB4]
MKMILFLLLCALTFCLPFKNKSVSGVPDKSTGAGELSHTTETGDSLKVETMQLTSKGSMSGSPGSFKAMAEESSKPDTVSFLTQIQPILKTRCNPCHFPGGKMYEKMPFDQARTILDHPEGVLKRIKDGEEGRLMRQFLEKS